MDHDRLQVNILICCKTWPIYTISTQQHNEAPECVPFPGDVATAGRWWRGYGNRLCRSSTDVEAYFRLGRMQGSAGSVGEKRELFIERRRVAAWRPIWNWSWDCGVPWYIAPYIHFPRGSHCAGRHETVESNDTSNKKRRHVWFIVVGCGCERGWGGRRTGKLGSECGLLEASKRSRRAQIAFHTRPRSKVGNPKPNLYYTHTNSYCFHPSEWLCAGSEEGNLGCDGSPSPSTPSALSPRIIALDRWAAGAPSPDATPTALEWAAAIAQSTPALQSLVPVVTMRRGVRPPAGAVLQGEAQVRTHQARGAEQVQPVSSLKIK